MPVRTWNSSVRRCGEAPTPVEPYDNVPGLDLASAINSLTLETPIEGCTVRIIGWPAIKMTGVKSRTMSNDCCALINPVLRFTVPPISNV